MNASPDITRGWELHQAGRLRDAEELYRRALRATPRDARLWFALAQLCDADRRPHEAAACFRQGLEIEPREAEGHFLLGNTLLGQSKWAEAEAAYRRCVQLRPDHAAALVNLGFALGEQNRLEEARGWYEQALKLRPDQPEVHHNLGNALRELGRREEAVACYNEAIRLRPDYAKAFVNRGVALIALGRIDEALADLERGAALRPDLADAQNSLGSALTLQHRFDEAMASLERALTLSPGHPEAEWNRSILWLLLGDHARGWPAFEWRWRCRANVPLPAFTQPRWDGSPLNGRTILLYGEQGLGDAIQFVRYAAMVKARGGRVIAHVQGPLAGVLARTPGIDRVVPQGGDVPPFDVWSPLMSLPALFGTTVETVPAAVPYVHADPGLTAHWRRQLAGPRGLRVGIVWQGNPKHAWDRHRSVALERFEPLAGVEGARLISLQKGPGAEQLAAVGERFAVMNLGEQLDEATGPFMDTAAVLANLDLVITVDSAVAHLAGAMGVPTWVALSYTPDWRWLLGRTDTPWYPTMRLFRQRRFGDWDGVFAVMTETLRHEVAHRPAGRPLVVEVSAGELLDKLTILRIKDERMTDEAKRRNVRAELTRLEAVRREDLPAMVELEALVERLKAVNERLWEVEDEIRECERAGDFGERFVALARAVYHENDRRAAIKREINHLLGSALVEEKSYAAYGAGE